MWRTLIIFYINTEQVSVTAAVSLTDSLQVPEPSLLFQTQTCRACISQGYCLFDCLSKLTKAELVNKLLEPVQDWRSSDWSLWNVHGLWWLVINFTLWTVKLWSGDFVHHCEDNRKHKMHHNHRTTSTLNTFGTSRSNKQVQKYQWSKDLKLMMRKQTPGRAILFLVNV